MSVDDVDKELLQATVARALSRGGDFSEVFVEDRTSLGLRLEDGKVEDASGGHEFGAAVRLNSDERTYYAYTDEVTEQNLLAAADSVATAMRGEGGGAAGVAPLGKVRRDTGRHPLKVPPETVTIRTKSGLLRAGDEAARAQSAEVAQVIVAYSEGRQVILIANSEGELVRDDRTRLRLVATVVARRDGIIQTGFESLGKSMGFELLDERVAREIGQRAAEKAVTMLAADPSPAGPMPVVMANGFGGTLFHEACGHGLEADAIAKGASIYTGRLGDVVAAPIVSAYDDGTITNEWGSGAFDDEGVPTQRTLLIEEGSLRQFLYDRLRARKAGVDSTGNGRRQSFRHVPIPRMTTTFIAGGSSTEEEVIAETRHGFYAKSLAGGQVEPASGNFVFGVAEGYLIENGAVTKPLRGATLVGNGIEVLKNIDMIAGDDFLVKSGMCGKDGQSVPVGTGQPTLRIRQMTVGGTG